MFWGHLCNGLLGNTYMLCIRRYGFVILDKCAFFLVNASEQGPQIYDLVAGSKDEKNK